MRSFALASGSSGNCFYIESTRNKFLVDLGLRFSKTKEILEEKGIDIYDINGIFITHEHSDHILGFDRFYKELDCNFYMTKGTFEHVKSITKDFKNIKFVSDMDVLSLEDVKVFVVDKPHDAREAVNFVFENGGGKIGIFTDLGHITQKIKSILKSLDVLYIEANYCDDFIKNNGKHLNMNYLNRLMSDVGHLSISQTVNVLKDVVYSEMKVILCHISENTNFYENVYLRVKNELELVEKLPEILISFQNEPTVWIE